MTRILKLWTMLYLKAKGGVQVVSLVANTTN